ncbi:glutamyl-tRNA reductase [Cryomorpha ignava]|uniref:Glutamyl-tRNA reductase n=1 Tax=Cryomorpha ignava TaxID=101383 RepID=A0A7K3WR63_9FLAO|nr:glutamyl-tRNA reductase [Cryomorpha ignava]NEN23531.1 glutamyl-tRNA reductase [Cryomorpha ignava]
MITQALRRFSVFAFTHKVLPLEMVGKFHIDPNFIQDKLTALKKTLKLDELMYLSTCNRVEFLVVQSPGNQIDAKDLVAAMDLDLSETDFNLITKGAEVHRADDGVKHLFRVSASLDSMVIGEREIITQVRKSYEDCHKIGLTGDFIRLLIRKTIETAKLIFTETAIFKKPVSVVSLGFHRLRDLNMPADSRIVMIGAGKTNRAMIRFLAKHGYKNIHIYNRSVDKAVALANEVGAKASALTELPNHTTGFDICITCTSSGEPVLTEAIYDTLAQGEKSRKVIIDLAIPGDVSTDVLAKAETSLKYIDIAMLKVIADKNLAERSSEIKNCEVIIDTKLMEFHDMYRDREVELAMRQIPQKVKEIRDTALGTVYAKELSEMNAESREVLDKVIAYMEKKYISVPMKMAKEVMLNKSK